MVTKVSPKKFVEAWETSHSISEVEQKTGLKYNAVLGRARIYKRPVFDRQGNMVRPGLQLKAMPRNPGTNRVDSEKLTELVHQLPKG